MSYKFYSLRARDFTLNCSFNGETYSNFFTFKINSNSFISKKRKKPPNNDIMHMYNIFYIII